MMGIKTGIEYPDSTLNLQMGCDGCELWNPKTNIKNCYAGVLTKWYGGGKGWPVTFDQPATFLHRLDQALKWPDLTGINREDKPWLNGLPRVIFTNDMGDPFTESLSLDWFHSLVPQMATSPHVYIWLTKRPKRMYKSFQQLGYIPDNFWLMTSITDQATTARIADLVRLKQINSKVILGLSIEPLLGPVDLNPWLWEEAGPEWAGKNPAPDISWVIVGGESGPNARPMPPDWVRTIREQCVRAYVPFFFKQWGEWAPDCLCPRNDVCTRIPRPEPSNGGVMFRCGKKHAGRILDGRTWDQMPEVIRTPVSIV